MIKNTVIIIPLLLLSPFISDANIQQDKVTKAMVVELNKWTSKSQIQALMEETSTMSRDKPVNVTVIKQSIIVDGKKWTLGKGSVRVLIKAPIDRVKKLLTSPSHFQSIYNLDAPCIVDENLKVKANSKLSHSGDFLARIYKRVSYS